MGQSPTMEKILNSGLNLNGTAINAGLNVPDSDSMRSSQALMLGQLSRGVVYIAGMNESIKGMDEKLDKLPERIAKELKKVLKHFLSKERTCAKKG